MVTIPQHRILLSSFVTFVLMVLGVNARAAPEISWDSKLATPGVQITFEKDSESSYAMRVTGLPKGKDYVFWMKWVDGKTQRFPAPDADGFSKGVELKFEKMYRGEPMNYAVISTDQTVKAYAELIPFPLEATGAGGCKLSLTLLSPNLRLFVIIGQGFQPGEPVTTTSTSDTEVLKNEKPALSDGRIAAYIDPGVIGKTGGLATFQASSKSCDVTLHYAWGTAMKRVDE